MNVISELQAKHLRQLKIIPKNIIGYYVQYDIHGYWPMDKYEYWDMETKAEQDKLDYGYSNPCFFPACDISEYENLVNDKPDLKDEETWGIADYDYLFKEI